jgi:predicted phosphodiesterase
MARTALITDIHGELDRLKLVLADIARRGCERVVCLGDCVDERAGGAPVLTELLRVGVPSVVGNCDHLCDLPDGSAERAFVDAMPRAMSFGDVVLTHISPVAGSGGVRGARDAQQVFIGTRQRVAFVGHVHVPRVFMDSPALSGGAISVSFEYEELVRFQPGRRYVVSVGPVGHGRDGVEQPRYAVWDEGGDGVMMVCVGER